MKINPHYISIARDDVAVDMSHGHSGLLLKRPALVAIVVLPDLSIPGTKRIAITRSLGLLIQRPQGFHDVVEAHVTAFSGGSQRWCCLNRTGIGRPRGENGSFFVEGQVWIVHHF